MKINNDIAQNTMCIVFADLLFVVLPLIVIFIVFSLNKDFHAIFHATEWSFAAAVLFGQTIVKLVSGLLSTKISIHWQRPILIITALIVFGLVPSLIVLTLTLTSQILTKSILIAQIVLFIISVLSYLIFGGVGQTYFCRKSLK